MPQQRRRPPSDHTGAKREQLEREHSEELARRQGEMSMAARVAAETKDEVVDLAEVMRHAEEAEETGQEVQVWETVGEEGPRGSETVVIQVNTELKGVTIGAGNHYDFEEGQRYRVPVDVASHLEEKGYVWH